MKSQQVKKTIGIKSMCFTAVACALVFVFTYTFKIPLGTGYTHLGDSIIFLSIALLGSKKSSLAAGLGASLADLIGGYPAWILPTFFIKLVMALLCGLFAEKLFKGKLYGYIIGAAIAGLFQIGGYTLAKLVMYDSAYALSTLPALVLQSAVGIAVAIVFIGVFKKTKADEKFKRMVS